ncbi:MAG: methylenetetrahydrofolate reductase, partial [Candidatus Hydrogenedentota bacterium]
MGLREVYRDNDFVLSYELFPPKSDAGMEALGGHVRRLLEYSPDFVTCTYGAGGSTRDKTLATLAVVQGLSDRPVASHLTCVGGTYES